MREVILVWTGHWYCKQEENALVLEGKKASVCMQHWSMLFMQPAGYRQVCKTYGMICTNHDMYQRKVASTIS
jgi:hypothetical protein